MTSKISQRRDDLRQAQLRSGPQGRTWEAIEKGGDGPSPLGFDIAWVLILSARSLLISGLPHVPSLTLTWTNALSLNQCHQWVWPCAGRGGFPRVIRSKKECIKSCETCFANTLNLGDKGPSMKWVCSPKFYGPLTIWPWLRISPEFFECYLLFDHFCLTMIDELYI